VGIDQTLTRDVRIGAEGSRRDLEVTPGIDPVSGLPEAVRWKEWGARGYLFWSPHRQLAIRAEYLFERVLGDERLTLGARSARTHRVPLGAAVFLPYNVALSATATYFRQEGTFVAPVLSPTDSGFQEGADRFWIVDASLSWRLPRRNGVASISATNLLDEKFRFFEQSSTSRNPTVLPVRTIFARLTLAGP
jgi:outer membrane receptor protein involved in Fe transport